MAASQVASVAEKAFSHEQQPITGDITNFQTGDHAYANQMMKALIWDGKNTVKLVDTPRPKIIDDGDVILKVTGSTICGSDLHLFHGIVPELQKGDILGHEFCGVVDQVGPKVSRVKPGDRVVASFQIACGECYYCQKKLSSMCEKTNANALANKLYGRRTAGAETH